MFVMEKVHVQSSRKSHQSIQAQPCYQCLFISACAGGHVTSGRRCRYECYRVAPPCPQRQVGVFREGGGGGGSGCA